MSVDVVVDLRAEVLQRAQRGELLSAGDMALIFHMSGSRFSRLAATGAWERFKTKPALGRHCYSGVLVWRFVSGEPLYVPSFGKSTRRG